MGNLARDVLFRMPARDVIRYTLFKVTSIDELDARTSSCNDSKSALRISQFGACDTEGTSIILILCACTFLEHSSDPSMKSTCTEPHMSLYLWQMWSAKAQESMCVCTISSGSRSLTKFKVENKNSRHLSTYVYFKILVSGFLYVIMAILINQKHLIPQNGTF